MCRLLSGRNEQADLYKLKEGHFACNIHHSMGIIFQAFMFALWLEKDIQGIADTPKIHHQLNPNQLYYQTGFNLVSITLFRDCRLFQYF